jgi:mannuronan synthase
LPPDLVAKCAPFLLDPTVRALTTDEFSEVRGREIFRRWYAMRFAQRDVLMSSMGLSRRVMTLTGRMSMFRASIVCNPGFIAQVEFDYLDHWRLGRFKFLTGDDKSTWYWLLKNDYKMLYIPDVAVTTIEDPPDESFFVSARLLMTRWFGNMLRNNSRALALGPSKIGPFVWWTILDQRVSMWTSLSGVVFCLLGTLFVSPYAMTFYVFWVMASRYIITLTLLMSRPRVSVLYPFLLYFNQIYGSWVKTSVFFRLDKQKWTRQGTTNSGGGARRFSVRAFSSAYMHAFAWLVFVTAIAGAMGLIKPSFAFWRSTL